MEGYRSKYPGIHDWEVVRLEGEYGRLLHGAGHSYAEAPLEFEDLDKLLDVYHYWKILYNFRVCGLPDMDIVLHVLHFDVILELYGQRKLNQKYHALRYIFD